MAQLYYQSTRGNQERVPSAEAILQGIAKDGGLFVPDAVPVLATPLETLQAFDYRQLAYEIMKLFLTDFTEDELKQCIDQAYDKKFDTPEIAPLQKKAGVSFLELYHGPTLAFKDMALSILPYLLQTAARKLSVNKEIVILAATSGDTGKAALEGFADIAGTKIIVFFPEHGVSQVQKRQMTTQIGDNTYVIGIEGNFDDAQSGVKRMFADQELLQAMDERGYMFSSANSINIGRLVPQVVYYFHAYLRLCSSGEIELGEEINFAVPTGNFGNILAGYYAKKMGLPVKKLICASNENKVLYDFFQTGTYNKNREFVVTMSPSMDILVSSNLERLLYHVSGEDGSVTGRLMKELSSSGKYDILDEMKVGLGDFFGGYASEDDTARSIRELFLSSNYLIDTHTAVAYSVCREYEQATSDPAKIIVIATASPYKFPADVMKSIEPRFGFADEFALLQEMSKLTGHNIPEAIKDIGTRPVLHKTVCETEAMKGQVEEILGI
jgi:threonine synthase